MKQAILTICAMCMFSAICAQILAGNGHMRIVRMVMGLQVFLTVITLMCEVVQMLS